MAAGLAGGVLLAPRLFLAARAYPRVPVLERWPLLPAPLDVLVLGALLAALIGVALAPRPRWWAAAATGLVLVLGADDQSRWQPWFYQYAVMLATLALARDAGQTVRAWRVVLVGLYLWSGIQKLNVTFVTLLFPWLIEPLARGVPGALKEVITLGRTLKKRADDVLAYFDRPGTSNGPTEAINGRLEHLRGSALGFRNLTNYIARSLLETGGFRPQLHPRLG